MLLVVTALLSIVVAHPAPAVHAVAVHRPPSVNPHLHGLSATSSVHSTAQKSEHESAKGEHPGDAHKHDRRYVHHEWVHRWDYVTWINLHRHLGTIRGQVMGGGRTKVWLRHPNGSSIRSYAGKHIVYSAPNGMFVMSGVRAGRYRIIAHGGGHDTHEMVYVHPGAVNAVAMRL